MSSKRLLVITAIGVLFIAAFVGVMLLPSFFGRDSSAIPLPSDSPPPEISVAVEPDALDRVEVAWDTVQTVISQTLSRPETYSRIVTIEKFWEGGNVTYDVSVSVAGGVTSLRTLSYDGAEKRIIVTPRSLYIWYEGDTAPFIGNPDSLGDGQITADEWQMLVTYEDVLRLNEDDIIEAGHIEWGGHDCVYTVYMSPILGYTRRYYISLEYGHIVGAFEYDETGALTYRMSSGDISFDDIDPAEFTLPDGKSVIE